MYLLISPNHRSTFTANLKMFTPFLFLLLLLILLPALLAQNLTAIDAILARSAAANHARLIAFLRIPSISSDPSQAQAVRLAGNWLVHDLESARLDHVRLLETARHPAVYADWLHAPGKPTVLLYAHFDVQPADPLDLWTSPPFEPDVRDGRIYARGASDDKGHLYVVVAALRAMIEGGGLPVNVKVLFEGEEEIGSPNLKALLEEHKALLKADYAFCADGGQISTELPGICVGLRGALSLQLSLRVADVDMHSGTFGGGVQNPIYAMSKLLASMWEEETMRIAVDGFYDDVVEISEEERRDIANFPIDAAEKLKGVGVNVSVGEEGLSFYERYVD